MAVPGPPEACRENASSVPVFKEGRREKRASVPEVSRAGAPRVLLPVRAPVFLGIARYRGRYFSASRGAGGGIPRHHVVQPPAFLGMLSRPWYRGRNFPAGLKQIRYRGAFFSTDLKRTRYRERIFPTGHWPNRYSRQHFSARRPGLGTEDVFPWQTTGQAGTGARFSRHAFRTPVQPTGFLASSGRASSCGRTRARWRPAPRACQWWRPRR